MKTALSRTDFRILEATGGRAGLRMAQEMAPNVVILDLSMPDMTGFEVLDQLKQSAQTASIPVIVHTSKVLDDHEREMLAPAVAIVSKENTSREALLDNLAKAFREAGFPVEIGPVKEAQHG
jgi:CheY-like chemotaxis protein